MSHQSGQDMVFEHDWKQLLAVLYRDDSLHRRLRYTAIDWSWNRLCLQLRRLSSPNFLSSWTRETVGEPLFLGTFFFFFSIYPPADG